MILDMTCIGQSNCLGRGAGGPDWSGISENVRVFNNVNPLGFTGNAYVTAAQARAGGTFEYLDRNNAFVWLADKIARTQFDSVDMTIVARGSSPIELWRKTETQYPMLRQTIDVWAATGKGPSHILAMHQGEGNLASSAAHYHAEFEGILANLTEAGVIDASTIILVGEIAEAYRSKFVFNRDVLATMRSAVCARAAGLSTYDGTHFDGAGLTRLGSTRYYSAYIFARAKRGL